MQFKTNKIILFDLDRTLYNTALSIEITYKSLAKFLDVTPEYIADIAQHNFANKWNTFSPTNFAKILSLEFSKPIHILAKYVLTSKAAQLCVYSDVIPSLKTLKQYGYKLGIFSEGEKEYQLIKLNAVNKFNLFDPNYIFISSNKLRILKQLPPVSIIVDDKLSILNTIKKSSDKSQLIWINRNNKQKAMDFVTIYRISDLVTMKL